MNRNDFEKPEDAFGSFTEYGKYETMMIVALGAHDLELKWNDDKIKGTSSGNPKNWHRKI